MSGGSNIVAHAHNAYAALLFATPWHRRWSLELASRSSVHLTGAVMKLIWLYVQDVTVYVLCS